MRIAIFGLGYVGTVTAAGLASRGHHVCGVDVDQVKVDCVRAGSSPVVEPGLDQLIAEGVRAGRLTATTDPVQALSGAELSLLCVGTPSSPQGSTDLSYLTRAATDIRRALSAASPPESGFHALVVRSTVPPGTGDQVIAPLFGGEPLPSGWQVSTAMCPEFLREGSGLADFFDPPLVVLGAADDRVADLVAQMFAFLGQGVQRLDVRSAEALKYACNAFHATKVSFTNEMARILRTAGIDSRKVMDIFCSDRTLNVSAAYLRPGFAFGGSCLPKDLRALLHMARMNALDVPLLAGIARSNEIVVMDAIDRVIAGPAQVVAVLGLSFKMNTDDLRESPNVDLAERLIGKGFEVRIYDPIIHPDRLTGANLRYVQERLPHLSRLLTSSPAQALAGSNIAVVATADPSVREQLRGSPPARILDLNGHLGPEIEHLPGYEGIGWVA